MTILNTLLFVWALASCSEPKPAGDDVGQETDATVGNDSDAPLAGSDTGLHANDDTDTGDGDVGDGDTEGGTSSGSTPTPDPFKRWEVSNEGLVNTSFNLNEMMEFGELDGSCDAWRADRSNRRLKLMCGKWMFFYEGFGTLGIPEPIVDWVARNFPDADEAGPAFTHLGLIMDPYRATDAQPRHLGLGYGADLGTTPTLALTCANCHFGQLPDGRYSIGYPNLQYEYGEHMLSLVVGPRKGIPGFDPSDHHPDALAKIEPMLSRFDEDWFLGLGLLAHMLPMLAGGMSDIPELHRESQGQYASWKSGTMDFTIAPLPIDDDVHTVSRILPLWDIPSAEVNELYGMDSAMLAWTGSARTLNEFLSGFVSIGGGPIDEWGESELSPLHDFILTLRAPEPLTRAPEEDIAAGRELFQTAGCEACHAGPSGSGVRVFEFDETETDAAMAMWGDADGDGEMCCGVDGELTGGIKAPRLRGVHSFTRFLHNGSLESLEELLCMVDRPASLPSPWANHGHTFGCDLPIAERTLILSFLRSL